MVDIFEINRLLPSASNDVKKAIRNIDMLDLHDIEKALPCFYPDQFTADIKMLSWAAELLCDTLDDESTEYSAEERKLIHEYLHIAYRLINLYNQAWQRLRYGHEVIEEY